MMATPLPIVTSERFVHPMNALPWMLVTLGGITTLPRAKQLPKAVSPISPTPLPIVRDESFSQ